MKKSKKGQQALEFLITYGWAFLVVLIMFSALFYFGIFNFQKYLPERCDFGDELDCVDFLVDATNGEIKFNLTNTVGVDIFVKKVDITLNEQISCDFDTPDITKWDGGGKRDFFFSNCNLEGNGFFRGSKGEVKVTIQYYADKSSPKYLHDIHGRIYANVQ